MGQRLELTLTIWVRAVEGLDGRRLPPEELLEQHLLELAEPGVFARAELRAETREAPGEDGMLAHWYAFEADADFLADRPGPLTIAPVRVEMAYPTHVARNIFGGPEVTQTQARSATSEPLVLDAAPLPEHGQPDNFKGAVGFFSIRTLAEPLTARVGDPIELIVEVSGSGPLKDAPPPVVVENEKLQAAFRVAPRTAAGEMNGERKLFRYTLRPLRAGRQELPPLEYSYFNPALELYAVSLSAPIPIHVLPAPEFQLDELAAGATTLRDRTGLGRLPALETRAQHVLRRDRGVTLLQVLLIVFLPPTAFVLTWSYVRLMQRGEPQRSRRRAALRAARGRLHAVEAAPPGEAAASVAAALREYLGACCAESPARVDAVNGAVLLRERGVDQAIAQQWRELMERCERATFAGHGEKAGEIVTDGALLLARLSREQL